jgi:pimeloyl-ACP methyl ester carboxylesterase
MKKCLSSLNGDPRFYTTAEAMRDLDEARAALGYDKINFYGISYGATAAQVYMRLFPQRVRAAVLDHGTALDVPFAQAMPRASQSALDQIFTLCEQDEKCHAAYPDIRGDWKSILNRLAKGPVVTSYTPDGATAPMQVTLDAIAQGAHSLLYKSGGYAMLPSLIHTLAATEDWTQVVKSFDQQQGGGQANNFQLMSQMIFCFEPAWGFQADTIARLNPDSYYREVEVKNAQTQQKICAALPKPDPAVIYGSGKPVPVSALMLNSRIDPQNPPDNMEPALKEFTQSRMIIEPTEGHETTLTGCRWNIVTQYIQQGSASALDISCIEKQQPSFLVGN